ncbi:hypothetical protein [Halomicrococcus sp. NG-SE-24]
MTDDEIAELRERMYAQREDIRAALADDFDGDSDDYRVDDSLSDDGDTDE